MDAERSEDGARARAASRRDRQRAEIECLVGAGHLARAADLAHEHLAEFHTDACVRATVVDALAASREPVLRARAGEFTTI